MSSLRLNPTVSCATILVVGLLGGSTCFATPSAAVPAGTLLRWKFNPGEHLVVTSQQDIEIEMVLGDMPMTSNMQQTLTSSWQVKEVDDEGTASISVTIDRMKMGVAAQGFKVGFDTADKASEQPGPLGAMADAVKKLIGLSYNLKIAPTGEIVDLSVPKATRDALKEQFNAIPGMQQMADMFTDEGVKNMAQQVLHSLPDKPVSEGDTWTKEGTQKVAQLGEHKSKTVYEYAGAKDVDGRAIQQIKATMTTDFAGAKSPIPGGTIDIEDQKMSGVIQFDNELGRMTRSDFDLEIVATLTIADQSYDQQIKGKIVTTVKPAEQQKADSAADDNSDTDKAPTDQADADKATDQ